MAQFIESKWLSKAKATPWLHKCTNENWRIYVWQRKMLTVKQQNLVDSWISEEYLNEPINNQYSFNKALIKLKTRNIVNHIDKHIQPF